jgi:hypothetical protein
MSIPMSWPFNSILRYAIRMKVERISPRTERLPIPLWTQRMLPSSQDFDSLILDGTRGLRTAQAGGHHVHGHGRL